MLSGGDHHVEAAQVVQGSWGSSQNLTFEIAVDSACVVGWADADENEEALKARMDSLKGGGKERSVMGMGLPLLICECI